MTSAADDMQVGGVLGWDDTVDGFTMSPEILLDTKPISPEQAKSMSIYRIDTRIGSEKSHLFTHESLLLSSATFIG
jgi:hypothetical protein